MTDAKPDPSAVPPPGAVVCAGCGTCTVCRLARKYPKYRRFVGTYPEAAGLDFSGVPAATRTPVPEPPPGPGTELKALLAEFGVTASRACSCNAFARKMDGWGVAGCRDRRGEVVEWLRTQQRKAAWAVRLGALVRGAAHAVCGGFVPDPADVCGSLVDEACRRAETKCGAAPDVLPGTDGPVTPPAAA